jgi:hypothetical protein
MIKKVLQRGPVRMLHPHIWEKQDPLTLLRQPGIQVKINVEIKVVGKSSRALKNLAIIGDITRRNMLYKPPRSPWEPLAKLHQISRPTDKALRITVQDRAPHSCITVLQGLLNEIHPRWANNTIGIKKGKKLSLSFRGTDIPCCPSPCSTFVVN